MSQVKLPADFRRLIRGINAEIETLKRRSLQPPAARVFRSRLKESVAATGAGSSYRFSVATNVEAESNATYFGWGGGNVASVIAKLDGVYRITAVVYKLGGGTGRSEVALVLDGASQQNSRLGWNTENATTHVLDWTGRLAAGTAFRIDNVLGGTAFQGPDGRFCQLFAEYIGT